MDLFIFKNFPSINFPSFYLVCFFIDWLVLFDYFNLLSMLLKVTILRFTSLRTFQLHIVCL